MIVLLRGAAEWRTPSGSLRLVQASDVAAIAGARAGLETRHTSAWTCAIKSSAW
jgi:hypothetical protein